MVQPKDAIDYPRLMYRELPLKLSAPVCTDNWGEGRVRKLLKRWKITRYIWCSQSMAVSNFSILLHLLVVVRPMPQFAIAPFRGVFGLLPPLCSLRLLVRKLAGLCLKNNSVCRLNGENVSGENFVLNVFSDFDWDLKNWDLIRLKAWPRIKQTEASKLYQNLILSNNVWWIFGEFLKTGWMSSKRPPYVCGTATVVWKWK